MLWARNAKDEPTELKMWMLRALIILNRFFPPVFCDRSPIPFISYFFLLFNKICKASPEEFVSAILLGRVFTQQRAVQALRSWSRAILSMLRQGLYRGGMQKNYAGWGFGCWPAAELSRSPEGTLIFRSHYQKSLNMLQLLKLENGSLHVVKSK